MRMPVADVQRVLNASLLRGDAKANVRGVSLNSKTITKGNLFIAIKGQRCDGHDYIHEAVRSGASAIVVSRVVKRLDRIPSRIPVLKVPDTMKALGQLARYHRLQWDVPVIVLTGSAGKTTTKELVARVLEPHKKILKNRGTENNAIGLPMTLLKLGPEHDAVVVEAGTNRPGDIRELTKIACPTMAVLTNIGESHLELLKNPQSVFLEKKELLKGLPQGGVAVVNKDDPYLRKIRRRSGIQLITYGMESEADYRAQRITLVHNQALEFSVKGARSPIRLQTCVRTNVYNALAAICCGRLFNISYNSIINSLRKHRFTGGRQETLRINGHWLIDDSYNANPISVESALQTLASLQIKGKRVFVCADMLELGRSSEALHRQMGYVAARLNIDIIVTFGSQARWISQSAKKMNAHCRVYHYSQRAGLHKRLMSLLQGPHAFLVKGSRGMHMEKTVTFLRSQMERE